MVTNLQCPSDENGTVLNLTWSDPSLNPAAVNVYVVSLQQYIPIADSRDLDLSDVSSQLLGASSNIFAFTSGIGE